MEARICSARLYCLILVSCVSDTSAPGYRSAFVRLLIVARQHVKFCARQDPQHALEGISSLIQEYKHRTKVPSSIVMPGIHCNFPIEIIQNVNQRYLGPSLSTPPFPGGKQTNHCLKDHSASASALVS